MNRILLSILIVASAFGVTFKSAAQSDPEMKKYVGMLSNIDPEMRKYFPRWKICEPDLQFQIYKTFELAGLPKYKLNIQDIEVLAAPRLYPEDPFEVLMVTCGDTSMNSRQVDVEMPKLLEYLSGETPYRRQSRALDGERDYCYVEIPPEVPVNNTQAQAIQDYFKPTNVGQSITLSLFEQSLKIGDTDFWLLSKVGTDEIGYQFWSAGEAKIMLKRPLYTNLDVATHGRIPNLINAYLGGAYRINAGLEGNNSILSWIPDRILNGTPGGKMIGGLDVHMPFHPQAGLHLNVELPFQTVEENSIDYINYGKYKPSYVDAERLDPEKTEQNDKRVLNGNVAPIMKASGQITAFYNLWIQQKGNTENFFRFDLGISYAEIEEYAIINNLGDSTYISNKGIENLMTYKPDEFADWLYAKVEYRNQSTYPFSVSLQYSNQIMTARAYMPLFGNWFYLEGKFSQVLRDTNPFEVGSFFMISPVLRITI